MTALFGGPSGAKRIAFESDDGVLHPASVWLPGEITLDYRSRRARIRLLGWHDAASLAAGRRPIGVRDLALTDDPDPIANPSGSPAPRRALFDEYFRAALLRDLFSQIALVVSALDPVLAAGTDV